MNSGESSAAALGQIPRADPAKFAYIEENLYVAVVCDILDELGYRDQALHQRIRPVLPDRLRCGFVGRARTFQWMDMEYVVDRDPYGLEIDAMDSLKPGDVIVHSTDYGGRNAPWGELMTTVAIARGAVGCVCDSQVRDCNRIIDLGFPVYAAGIRPVDSRGRGRVMDFDVPVRCGDVLVRTGDLMFADFDGVVAVPRELETQVLLGASKKVAAESESRKALKTGASLRSVYDRYHVL